MFDIGLALPEQINFCLVNIKPNGPESLLYEAVDEGQANISQPDDTHHALLVFNFGYKFSLHTVQLKPITLRPTQADSTEITPTLK